MRRLALVVLVALLLAATAPPTTAYDFVLPHVIKRLEMRLNTDQPAPGTSLLEPGCPTAGTVNVYIGGVDTGIVQTVTRYSVSGTATSFSAPTEPAAGYCACKQKLGIYNVDLAEIVQETQVWIVCNFVNPLPTNMNGGLELVGAAFQTWKVSGNPNGYVAYQQWLPLNNDVIIAGSFTPVYSITLADLSYPDYGAASGGYDYCGQYTSNTYWWVCGMISKYPGRVQTTRTPWPTATGYTTIAVLYPVLNAVPAWTVVKGAYPEPISLTGAGLGMSGLRVNLVCDPSSMNCGSCNVAAGNTYSAATCTWPSPLSEVGAMYAYALLPTAWNLPDLVNPPLALQTFITCSITTTSITPVTLGTDTTTEFVVNGAGYGPACSYGTCADINIQAQYGQYNDEYNNNVQISVISPTELRFKKNVANSMGGNRRLNVVRKGLGSGSIPFPMKPTLTSATGAPFASTPGSVISLSGLTLGVTFSPNCLSSPCSAPTCQYGTCASSGVTFTGTTATVTSSNVRVISATSMELKLSSYAAVSGSNFDISVSIDGYASAPITIGPFAPTGIQPTVLPIVPLNNFPTVITIYGAGFEPSVTSVTLSQGACNPDVVVRDNANNRQYLKCNMTSYPTSMADLKLVDLVAGGQSLTNPGAVSILHVGIGITDTEKTQLISRAVGTEISITGVGFGAACDYGSCSDTQIALVLGGAAGGSCPVATNVKIVSDTLVLCKVATPFYQIGVVTALFTRNSDTTNLGNVATVYPEVFGDPITSISITQNYMGNFTVYGFGIGASTWTSHKLKLTFSNGISCSLSEEYTYWNYNSTLCSMGGFPTTTGPFYLTLGAFGYWTGSPVLVGSVAPSPIVTPETTLRMAWGTQAQITIAGSNFPNNPHLLWIPESSVPENIVSATSTQIVATYAAPVYTELSTLHVIVRGADGSVGSRGAEFTMCIRATEVYLNEYNATLQCPNGGIISSFSFADYGRPSGSCYNGAFPSGWFQAESTCTTANGGAKLYAEQMCLGKNSCQIPVKNAVMSIEDPCYGFQKWFAALYNCTYSCGGASPCQDGAVVRQLEASAEVVPWSSGYKLTLASPALRFRAKFFYQMSSCVYRAVGTSGVISTRSCDSFAVTYDSGNATLTGSISPALPSGTTYVEVQLTDAIDGAVTPWTNVADITATPTVAQTSDTISGVATEVYIHGTGFLSSDPSDYVVKLGPHDVPCIVTSAQPTLLNCTPEALDMLGDVSGMAVNASVTVYEVTATGYIGILRVLDWSLVAVAFPSNFSKPGANQALSISAVNLPTAAPDFQLEIRIVTSLGVNVTTTYTNEVITSTSVQCEVGPFGYFGTLQASVKAYGYSSPWVTVGFIRNGPRVSGSFYGKIAASSPEITVAGASFPTNPHPTVDMFAGPTSILLGIYPDGKISWQQAISFAEFTPISLNSTSKKRMYSYTRYSDTQVVMAITSWPAPLDTQRTDYSVGCRFNATVGTTIYEYYVDLGPIVPAAVISPQTTAYAATTSFVSVMASGFDPRNSPYNRIILVSDSNRTECSSVTVLSSTELLCAVPAGSNFAVGALSAELWSYGGPSNVANVGTIVAAATINPIVALPTWADDIPEFTITGTNFPSPSAAAGSASITLSNTTTSACSSIVFVSTTQMICRAAAPFTPGPLVVVVTVFGGQTSEIQIANIVARPTITPSDAKFPVNTVSLTIGGTGFDASDPNANKVYLSLPNSEPTCTISSVTTTSIVCTTAGLSQTGTLTAIVTSFGGNSTQANVAIIEGGVSSNILAGAVGGGVGGFIFLAALIALVVFLVLRQRKKKAIARADKFRRAASTASLEMQVVSGASGSNSGEATFKQFDMSLVQFGKELGAGAFGKVYEGQLGTETVAIKEAKITDPHARSEFFKEAELMLGMPPHENVVRTHGISFDATSGLCYIVMEMCYGSLDKLVFNENSHSQFKEEDIVRFARGIAAGMAHVAKNRIVHRDLACRNILLGRDGTPKISDFGMSRTVKETNQGQTASTVGPIQWMSPESMQLQYSEKSDVWMFGCLLYEVVAGEEPHKDRANDKLNLALAIRDTGLHPTIPEHAPQLIKDVMELCFAFNPAERPTFKLLSQILRGKISIKAAKEEIAESSQVVPDTASPTGKSKYESFQ